MYWAMFANIVRINIVSCIGCLRIMSVKLILLLLANRSLLLIIRLFLEGKSKKFDVWVYMLFICVIHYWIKHKHWSVLFWFFDRCLLLFLLDWWRTLCCYSLLLLKLPPDFLHKLLISLNNLQSLISNALWFFN